MSQLELRQRYVKLRRTLERCGMDVAVSDLKARFKEWLPHRDKARLRGELWTCHSKGARPLHAFLRELLGQVRTAVQPPRANRRGTTTETQTKDAEATAQQPPAPASLGRTKGRDGSGDTAKEEACKRAARDALVLFHGGPATTCVTDTMMTKVPGALGEALDEVARCYEATGRTVFAQRLKELRWPMIYGPCLRRHWFAAAEEVLRAITDAPAAAADTTPADAQGATAQAVPAKMLLSWGDIIQAVDLKNTSEWRRRLTRLAKNKELPITLAKKRGGQPRANRVKLLEAWNKLADADAIAEATQTTRMETPSAGGRVFDGRHPVGHVKPDHRATGHVARHDKRSQ
ncbi:MAG: hypothetical protein NTW87_05610 [Planctomycetota bacterium]|nr:hypothetical protein [Planctomycetota bacterium]